MDYGETNGTKYTRRIRRKDREKKKIEGSKVKDKKRDERDE